MFLLIAIGIISTFSRIFQAWVFHILVVDFPQVMHTHVSCLSVYTVFAGVPLVKSSHITKPRVTVIRDATRGLGEEVGLTGAVTVLVSHSGLSSCQMLSVK